MLEHERAYVPNAAGVVASPVTIAEDDPLERDMPGTMVCWEDSEGQAAYPEQEYSSQGGVEMQKAVAYHLVEKYLD